MMATTPTCDAGGWQLAELVDGHLRFADPGGLSHALADGFFFVRPPAPLDVSAGDRFARAFYLPADGDDDCRGFARFTPETLGERQGYHLRDVDQTEQFFLERRWWTAVYPAALGRQAEAMRGFALAVLHAVLAELDLPRPLWDQATGGCLSDRGTYHLTFNHFRSEVRARGLNVHKDSGWVTVLRSLEPGLEVLRGGEWRPITPIPGSFIVNFGCAMEILTRHTRSPVAAVAHRVVEIEPRPGRPDRFSYALFVDSSLDEQVCPGLYSYRPGHGLELATSFRRFLDEILKNTYQEHTVGLY